VDLRKHAGIKAGVGQPGSNAVEGHLLDDDQPCGSRASSWGEARRETCWRWVVAAGGTAWSSGGRPHDRPPHNPASTGVVLVIFLRTRHLLWTAR
jgi:hypothetical protein